MAHVEDSTEYRTERPERTITYIAYEPWLLGWARWEIFTELKLPGKRVARMTMAKGSWKWRGWKWRGQKARCVERTLDCNPYFRGPVIEMYGPAADPVLPT